MVLQIEILMYWGRREVIENEKGRIKRRETIPGS